MGESREVAEAIRKMCAERMNILIPDWQFDLLMRYHDAVDAIGDEPSLTEYILTMTLGMLPEPALSKVVEEVEDIAASRKDNG